jgi:Fe-S oxidoreductase
VLVLDLLVADQPLVHALERDRLVPDDGRDGVGYGGSLSGEHGDGQTRGELLPVMFGERLVEAFQRLKAIFDPDGRMNTGKVVDPYPLDAKLRLGGDWKPVDLGATHFAYPDDDGSFVRAATRCVGVGKCRQHTSDGTVMCPSYRVTREEEHSTRGRARLLFEMLNGHGDSPIGDGWRSEPVHDALDLCLACKGCRGDCPVNVDMATYKAEFLAHHYAGRLRPRHAYALGALPAAAQAVGRLGLAPLANVFTQRSRSRRLISAAAGLENRPLPRFADQTLQRWAARRERATGWRGEIVLWPDTFTNHFHPAVGRAAVEVLEHAGWTVSIPTQPLCCGLTWISTGQLDIAKRVLRRSIDALAGHVRRGGLVLGLEPQLHRGIPQRRTGAAARRPRRRAARRAHRHAGRAADRAHPGLDAAEALAPGARQVHCHQHGVLGWEADQKLLERCGVDARRLDSGCCGLAGNFGFEPGHLETAPVRRARPAPGGARGAARHGHPRRRLQLPDPDRTTRPGGPPGGAPGRAPRRPTRGVGSDVTSIAVFTRTTYG